MVTLGITELAGLALLSIFFRYLVSGNRKGATNGAEPYKRHVRTRDTIQFFNFYCR